MGCLIYSDPHEDGYFAGDAYPKGGFRPSQGVQRGSVLDLPVAPGDPLTPGVGATACEQSPAPQGDTCGLGADPRRVNARGGTLVPAHDAS